MNTVPQDFQPPYLAWSTFDGILDQLKATGIPDKIDRSVLVGKSGGDQSQFLRACRMFGLMDEETEQPTERMRELVNAEDRGPLLGQILRESYPSVVALGNGATQAMLEEKFREFGIEGDTVRKAIAFYLSAAKQTDIELSPRFQTTRPGAGGRRKRTPRKASSNGPKAEDPAPPPPPADPYKGLHPAIVTLVQSLPEFKDPTDKPEFPEANRKAWFAYAKATFDLIYSQPQGDSSASGGGEEDE
ncbi:MAG: hypothetical protein M3Y75_11020 [Actinomycetota bacterium]|nr:hypothetical protein [Actinomycetota bacterium]